MKLRKIPNKKTFLNSHTCWILIDSILYKKDRIIDRQKVFFLTWKEKKVILTQRENREKESIYYECAWVETTLSHHLLHFVHLIVWEDWPGHSV